VAWLLLLYQEWDEGVALQLAGVITPFVAGL